MKLAIAIIGTIIALVGVLFVIFKFVTPGSKAAATTVAGATAPAPAMPPSATDKTAQRMGAAAGLISAASDAAFNLGFGKL
jgi:hypothetical protein